MGELAPGLHIGGERVGGAGDDGTEAEARRQVSQLLGLDHLSLLVGSGYSTGLAKAAGTEPVDMAMVEFDLPFAENVIAHASSLAAARGVAANLEDQLNSAIALSAGLAIQGIKHAKAWNDAIASALEELATGILGMERGIAAVLPALGGDDVAVQRLMTRFIVGFGLRGPTSDRLHLFTTNYDRLIELACDLAGLQITDRFVGSVMPRFQAVHEHVDLHYPERRSAIPRPVAGVVRLGKLHGSIDWMQEGAEIVNTRLRVGAESLRSSAAEGEGPLMIYPNSMKDVETAQYPYAPLFRDFSAAVARPQSVLFSYGYGYGDAHINRVIAEMLTIPGTHLCCVAYDDPSGRIAAFLNSVPTDRWTLLLGSGFASIDGLVRLLPERGRVGLKQEEES